MLILFNKKYNILNTIKEQFSIKDLENLSGIKAHTIRIWEKRYGLLSPERTDTNIRYYSLEALQKLLNVSLLNSNGYKISKIAQLPDDKIPVVVREMIVKKGVNNYTVNSFKLAMLNFDYKLFNATYNQLLVQKSFREIFLNIFVQLLDDVGLLWQSKTITPAHEHFISNLIKQKIHLHIENLQLQVPEKNNKVFVLFLPLNEIHELGLLYLHLEFLLHWYPSIYLGQSVPVENLKDLQNLHDNITYVSYFTVYPSEEEYPNYVGNIANNVLRKNQDELILLGKKANNLENTPSFNQVKTYLSIENLVSEL